MRKSEIVVAIAVALVVVVGYVCTSADASSVKSQARVSRIGGLERVIDSELGIVCYYDSMGVESIDCLPITETKLGREVGE